MVEVSLQQTVRTVVEAFRLGMEGTGSEALTRATQLMEEVIAIWPEQDLQTLGGLLEQVLAAQSAKNFLYAADVLEYQLLPMFSEHVQLKGDQE